MSLVQQINAATRRVPAGLLYVLAVAPPVWLLYRALTGGLGIDPVKVIEHELGKMALQLLIATLLITPLRRGLGINLLKFRRALGVICFAYVVLHLLTWLVLDIQLLWGQIWADILKRPYITVGMLGFALLLPLALTSNNFSVRRLGPTAWRRLHRLAYPAAIAGATHYLMSVKAWPLEPVLYACVVAGVLLLRVPRPRLRSARDSGISAE